MEVNTETCWVKKDDLANATLIADSDILITGSGTTITFTNLTTGEDTYYRPDGDDVGYGVWCIAGHKTLPVFAFSELCLHPRILVILYSKFKIITTIEDPIATTYNSLTFSDTEHLVALTGMPNYCIQIWLWRTGVLKISITTSIHLDDQLLRVSHVQPLTLCQLSIISPQMNVYEIHGALDTWQMIDRTVKLQEFKEADGPFNCVFGNDGLINMVIGNGNVYQVSPITCVPKLIIEWTGGKGDMAPLIAGYKGGLLVNGPNCTVKYYKKLSGVWSEICEIEIASPISCMRNPYNKDVVIATTEGRSILKIYPDHDNKVIFLKNFPVEIKFFSFIHPKCEYVATVNTENFMKVYGVNDDRLVSELQLQSITCMKECTTLPIIGYGRNSGILILTSYVEIKSPVVIAEFYISHGVIEHILFEQNGACIAVADSNSSIFIIQGALDGEMTITREITVNVMIVDLCIASDIDSIYLSLITSLKEEMIYPLRGSFLKRIIVPVNPSNEVNISHSALPGAYAKLYNFSVNPICYYAIPTLSRYLHVVELAGDVRPQYCTVTETMLTIHPMRQFEMFINPDRHLLTFGIDGIICLYDIHSKIPVFGFMSHHRARCGVKSAQIDPSRKHILSHSQYGTLVCTKLAGHEIEETATKIESVTYAQTLKKINTPKVGYVPDNLRYRWTDIQEGRKRNEGHEKYRDALIKTEGDLDVLKGKLKILLDENDEASDDETLPIQAFNLDSETTEAVIEQATHTRDTEEGRLNEIIADKMKKADEIKNMCWDPMVVKGMKVRGIFTKMFIENYALTKEDPADTLDFERAVEARNTEMLVSQNDTFQPWKPQTTYELEEFLNRPPQIYEEFEPQQHFDPTHALSGTSAHNFITPIPNRYNQLEVVSMPQIRQERIMAERQNIQLREYFNKHFNELKETKIRAMQQILHKNARLREIQSEINIIAKLSGTEVIACANIEDPKYELDEQPEKIVTVVDSEVPVRPYVSPSLQKLLDEEAAEAERLRLAKLENDFRDRALIAMMDGVLEIRWEDEIKKDPPLPDCILNNKDPRDYDGNDLREIEEYEKKLEFLRTERIRYRKMLEDEQISIEKVRDAKIMEFNRKVGEILLLKLKVDSAIRQEELKQLRNLYFYRQKAMFVRKKEMVVKEMKGNSKKVGNLQRILAEVEQQLVDIRSEYEGLMSKDRLLDRQFKTNFADTMPRSLVDQVYKIFKRRPRFQMRSWLTPTILLELARRLTTTKITNIASPLPQDCYEYLTAVDHIDNYSQSPNVIEEHMWHTLCRMRRNKIESEFKIKAYGLQLAEIEATIHAFNREITAKKFEIASCDEKLFNIREERIDHSLNRSIQLVMKRGMVETELTGHMSDFEKSILLHVTDVNDINKIIQRAGMKKLKAMEHAAVFRRKIIAKEWEHRVLKMTVSDLENFKKTIEKCKITKEVQRWLKQKQKGWSEDLSEAALEREINAAVNICEKNLCEQEKINQRLREKIVAKQQENEILDRKIQMLNLEVTEQQLLRNSNAEEQQSREQKNRMKELAERARLVRQVQHQHAQIIELSAMLELQRLRTFPTLCVSGTDKK